MYSDLPLWTFLLTGALAILVGGLVAAYSAKQLSRLATWTSAYLVLIVGLFQAVIGVALHYLLKDPSSLLIALAFTMYNLGNAGVLLGTVYKNRTKNHRLIVDGGGGLLVISMVILIILAWGNATTWQLVLFYVVAMIILISVPIGLWQSRRRAVGLAKA